MNKALAFQENQMKAQVVAGMFLAVLLLSNLAAQAGQEENPLFIEGKNMAEELDISSLNDNAKLHWAQQFKALANEQQQLWEVAGQVVGGQCSNGCAGQYNRRLEQWENNLRRFINDATATLRAQKSSDPAWLKKCADKAHADREVCYLKGREKPINEFKAWNQQCWNTSIKQEKACY
jgi:hypothetical protein